MNYRDCAILIWKISNLEVIGVMDKEMMMKKKETRRKIKALKEELTQEQIKDFSHKIALKIIGSDYYKSADVIYPYIAYNQEVLTDEIIEDALKSGKKVAAPRVCGDHMDFHYITDLEHFELSEFNIPEPPASNEIAKDPRVLIIMPGVAFDPNLNRIGYGGGFYDKYLANHSDVLFTKVAITYDFQIVDELPTEEHDYKVDMVVTPSRVLVQDKQ